MSKPTKNVYSVTDNNGKSFWFRVGAVFANKDGSETMYLNCYPLPDEKGRLRLVIRDVDQDTSNSQAQSQRSAPSKSAPAKDKPSYRNDDQDVGY